MVSMCTTVSRSRSAISSRDSTRAVAALWGWALIGVGIVGGVGVVLVVEHCYPNTPSGVLSIHPVVFFQYIQACKGGCFLHASSIDT